MFSIFHYLAKYKDIYIFEFKDIVECDSLKRLTSSIYPRSSDHLEDFNKYV